MRKCAIFFPIALFSTTALAQPGFDRFEIINNVVNERTYSLPDARFADDSGLLNGRDENFYRNAGNLNAGTLNNSRLSNNLGNRTIQNAVRAQRADDADNADFATRAGRARRADRADFADEAGVAGVAGSAGSAGTADSVAFAERAGSAGSADTASRAGRATNADNADNADFATRARDAEFAERAENADFADEVAGGGVPGGRVSPVGSAISFSKESSRRDHTPPNGSSTRDYTIPSNAAKLLVEAHCSTENNNHSNQTAHIEVKFNGSFTSYITLCKAGDNDDDDDLDTSAGSTQFDIPSGATQVTVRQTTNGGDRLSITEGTLYWFG